MDRPTFTTLLFVLTTLAVVKNACCVTQSLTFELADNERTCFFEDFQGSARHVFEYSVLSGGMTDVDASLESPNGKILYKETKRKQDSVHFETSPGTYQFCFSNEFSTFTHKVVYLSVRPEKTNTLASDVGDDKPTVNTQAEESLEAIHRAFIETVSYQTDYRLTEARGRHMAEELNKGVQWWSFLEAWVILITGLGQVFVLRAFFTDQKASRRSSAPKTSIVSHDTL